MLTYEKCNRTLNWLFWAPLVCACLHIFEEFVFPGKFREWYTRYKPDVKKSISIRFLILINAGLLILCYDIGALKQNYWGTILWLGVMAMLAANGIWHLRGVLKTKSYSPGVVTGLLLYVPLAIYGYIYFLSNEQISFLTVLVVFVIGSSYQLWSNMFHRLRTKKIST